MKFEISSSLKVLKLIEIFKMIKHLGSYCTLFCKEDYIYIQCMDGSHVCLLDVKIMDKWFDSYEGEEEMISFGSGSIVKILNLYQPKTKIVIDTDKNKETLNIELNYPDNIEKYFKLPLIDIDTELLEPGENDYAMEITMKTKTLDKYVTELMMFGEVISIRCKDDKLLFNSSSNEGNYTINVPHDNIEEFVVDEDVKLRAKIDAKHLSLITKFFCVFKTIDLKVDNNFPLKVRFSDCGETANNSDEEDNESNAEELLQITYFIAPKTDDGEEDEDYDSDELGSVENEVV